MSASQNKELVAITSLHSDGELLDLVKQATNGLPVGSPFSSDYDSAKLREAFGLTAEHSEVSSWVFNDLVEACVQHHEVPGKKEAVRRATIIAVASLSKLGVRLAS